MKSFNALKEDVSLMAASFILFFQKILVFPSENGMFLAKELIRNDDSEYENSLRRY